MPLFSPSKVTYRGTDHTVVSSPMEGDYTVEASGIWSYRSSFWGLSPRSVSNSIFFGTGTGVTPTVGSNAIAIGDGASAGDECISIGRNSTSTGSLGFPGIAIGYACSASEENTAIGYASYATGEAYGSVSLGSGLVTTSCTGVVALGRDSTISNSNYSLISGGNHSVTGLYNCGLIGSSLSISNTSANLLVGESNYSSNAESLLVGFGLYNLGSQNLLVGNAHDASQNCCVVTGEYGDGYISGAVIHSVGSHWYGQGYLQSMKLHLVGFTSNTTPVVLTSTPRVPTATANNQLQVRLNNSITFSGLISAYQSPSVASGGGLSGTIRGRLVNHNGTIRLDSYTQDLFYNPDGCTLSTSLDQTFKTLTFTFTGTQTTTYDIMLVLDCVVVI